MIGRHLGPSWGRLGVALGAHFGGFLGGLGPSWRALGGFIGHLGGLQGALGRLGASKVAPVRFLGRLEAHLEACVAVLDAALGRSWAALGRRKTASRAVLILDGFKYRVEFDCSANMVACWEPWIIENHRKTICFCIFSVLGTFNDWAPSWALLGSSWGRFGGS